MLASVLGQKPIALGEPLECGSPGRWDRLGRRVGFALLLGAPCRARTSGPGAWQTVHLLDQRRGLGQKDPLWGCVDTVWSASRSIASSCGMRPPGHPPLQPLPSCSCDQAKLARGSGHGVALTRLRGLPPCLLDVLLRLVAQLDLQLLGLHLQVSLPLRECLPGLGSKDMELFTGSEPGGPHGARGLAPPFPGKSPFFSLLLWMRSQWL